MHRILSRSIKSADKSKTQELKKLVSVATDLLTCLLIRARHVGTFPKARAPSCDRDCLGLRFSGIPLSIALPFFLLFSQSPQQLWIVCHYGSKWLPMRFFGRADGGCRLFRSYSSAGGPSPCLDSGRGACHERGSIHFAFLRFHCANAFQA